MMARKRDLSQRSWMTSDLRLLRECAAAGRTMTDAAGMLGRARCAIACKAMREGIRFPRKGWRCKEFEQRAIEGSARLRDAILSLAA